MPQTPEYTVRLRTPHEHQREKETPEPLTSAGASGKGKMHADTTRAGERDMDTEKIPRAWIGEKVRVAWDRDPEALECVLLDRLPDGIVIEHVRTVEEEGTTYEGKFHIFISWTALSSIHKVVGR